MKDYIAEFQQKIIDIDSDCQNINIVNAGVMNHGKSSLLNALLGNVVFPENDIRTTVQIQSENWFDNVYLVDTPGLSAEQEDDLVAADAYRRANMILFVHTVAVGELHENELNAINRIKKIFDNDKFFCDHLCLVYTNKDAISEEDLTQIVSKSLSDIKTNCGIEGFTTFTVSNTAYRDAVEENDSMLITYSGIEAVSNYIKSKIPKLNEENNYFRGIRIDNEKKNILYEMYQEKDKIHATVDRKTEEIKQRQKNYLYKLESAISEYKTAQSKIHNEESQLQNLRNQLNSIRR